MRMFFVTTNLLITTFVGWGIYSFTKSVVWAVIGAAVVTGGAAANPVVALLAYPAIEYFFNGGKLTIFSALVVGVTLVQLVSVFVVAARQPKQF